MSSDVDSTDLDEDALSQSKTTAEEEREEEEEESEGDSDESEGVEENRVKTDDDDGDDHSSEPSSPPHPESNASLVVKEEDEDEGDVVAKGTSNETRQTRKRSANNDPNTRPFKRRLGKVNKNYLELLNNTIKEVADRTDLDEDVFFTQTQMGLVHWSALEKMHFFNAISRLGRHDLPGIAAKVHKSEVEVQHYIHLIEEARKKRPRGDRYLSLRTTDIPAAFELSQMYCEEEEEHADRISLKADRYDEDKERIKWGQDYWDVSIRSAIALHNDKETSQKPLFAFSQLFHAPRWLKLSEKIFMNSSTPHNNWRMVDDRRPSIWATAFQDFHSLAVSVTRRLVFETLSRSQRRIDVETELDPRVQRVVKKVDAQAAIASLGLGHNSKRFWRECSRRLGLSVFAGKVQLESTEQPMSHDYVERQLASLESEDWEDVSDELDVEGEDLDDEAEAAKNHVQGSRRSRKEDTDDLASSTDSSDTESGLSGSDDEISQEVNEALVHSATRISELGKERLRAGLADEREHERHADLHDEYVSYREEERLWAMLDAKPPVELRNRPDPGPPPPPTRNMGRILQHREDWMETIRYHSEWERDDGERGSRSPVQSDVSSYETEEEPDS
ncbi:hypothetical protein S40288_06123 [Stachybotrys chartarum IBT 40288]|nr:hypothetical protein S40288_06123 [Stachybotrys chartarum IBT 40288]